MKNENKFQRQLVKELKERYSGCVIQKQDPTFHQGIPDLLILYNDKWAMLEVKRSATDSHQPNQDWWVDKRVPGKDPKNPGLSSFAAFIFPENKDEVLHELDKAWGIA